MSGRLPAHRQPSGRSTRPCKLRSGMWSSPAKSCKIPVTMSTTSWPRARLATRASLLSPTWASSTCVGGRGSSEKQISTANPATSFSMYTSTVSYTSSRSSSLQKAELVGSCQDGHHTHLHTRGRSVHERCPGILTPSTPSACKKARTGTEQRDGCATGIIVCHHPCMDPSTGWGLHRAPQPLCL